jgi:hypothetical protein
VKGDKQRVVRTLIRSPFQEEETEASKMAEGGGSDDDFFGKEFQ